jgi:3-oxoadipate enol-lactonase
MPTLQLDADALMHYEVDDFQVPWRAREAVLLLHGNAESGAVWFGWVSTLAKDFVVVRSDMRGFGASTPMPRDHPWRIDEVLDDFAHLMDQLGFARFHVVGAKIGGTLALALAARYPERVASVTAVCALGSGGAVGTQVGGWLDKIERDGVESWARATMAGRLGSEFDREGADWWARLMGRTAVSTQLGFLGAVCGFELREELPKIRCPALVITTSGNALSSVTETRRWASDIPRSEVLVLPGDSFHAAASDPQRCAQATAGFIERHASASNKTATTIAGKT